jgi:hypothetical protein
VARKKEKDPGEPPDQPHPRRLANPRAKRPEHPKKEWDALVKLAWKASWWCERRKKYIYCYSPNGEDIVKVPMTPSDWRTIRNKKRDFKAAGLRM